jgi:hypothetical protein
MRRRKNLSDSDTQTRLRLRACKQGARHEGAASVPRSQEYPAHGALYRAVADEIQELLEGVSLKRDGQAQRVRTRLRSGPAVCQVLGGRCCLGCSRAR